MHWAIRYIGMDWVSGGRGPDCFDCWGLLMDVYKKQLGVKIENHPGVESCGLKETARNFDREKSNWIEINKPKDLCAVGLSRNKRLHHVGVYAEIDGGKIIHCQKDVGVTAHSIIQMKSLGFKTFRFYELRK